MSAALKTKSKKRIKISKLISCIVLSIYAISLLIPLVWAFFSALKDPIEYSTGSMNELGELVNGVNAWPTRWLFSNFITAFTELEVENNNMFHMLFNSIWYAGGGSFLGVFVSSMSAYVVSKYVFPGSKAFYVTVIVTMMIPIVGSLPSAFRIYNTLGLVESPLFLLGSAGGMGFSFLVLYAYFKNLSWTYAEAAFCDGASNFRVFFQIMLPQAFPSIAALFIVSFIGMWNDSQTPLIYLKTYPTLSSGIYVFQAKTSRQMNMPVLFAGILISMLPVVILFAAFQKYIMDMSIGGGLKG